MSSSNTSSSNTKLSLKEKYKNLFETKNPEQRNPENIDFINPIHFLAFARPKKMKDLLLSYCVDYSPEIESIREKVLSQILQLKTERTGVEDSFNKIPMDIVEENPLLRKNTIYVQFTNSLKPDHLLLSIYKSENKLRVSINFISLNLMKILNVFESIFKLNGIEFVDYLPLEGKVALIMFKLRNYVIMHKDNNLFYVSKDLKIDNDENHP
jgi:hypothetical protein